MAAERRKAKTEPDRKRARLIVGIVAAAIVLVVAAANGHLVYVAVTTAPDCVDHQETADGAPDTFRAAKSAC